MIEQREFKTPEEAAFLAATLIAFECEMILNNEDRISLEQEADIQLDGKLDYPDRTPYYHEGRLRLEAILSQAIIYGDYRSVKTTLAERVYGSEIGNDYRKLVVRIPDKAEPFVLPFPAHLTFDFPD